MGELVVILLLVTGVAILAPVADRFTIPGAVVMALYGIVLALIPGVPTLHLPPDLVLPLLLPPLLFAASQRGSTREFIEHARGLVGLAIGLVLVSTAAVAVATHLVDPNIAWAPAVALGALVAPPDPVAATAVAGKLHLPRRVVEVLEGEGLLNDATSLTVYTIAVGIAGGSFSAASGIKVFVLSVAGAPLLGYLVGRVGALVLDRLEDPRAEVTFTLLLPYGSYLAIDALGGSGVLAVVVTGLYVGQRAIASFSSRGFLVGATVWNVADWTVSSFTFGLIGFELTKVLQSPLSASQGASVAAVVVVVAIGVRALFVLPFGVVMRRRAARLGEHPTGSQNWRESVVIAFAGMRGVVTLATAIALPLAFPARPIVVLSAIVVVLVTLVGQGLTLPALVRKLGVTSDESEHDVDETRRRAIAAALERLGELRDSGKVDERVATTLERNYQRIAPGAMDELDEQTRAHLLSVSEASHELREAERAVVLDLRTTGQITAEAASQVLRDLEAREQRGLRGAAAIRSTDDS
jgi:CPA1 family monovalent cation:H+ antiporter